MLNQQRTGQVVPVRVQGGHYLVQAEVLRARHVPLAPGAGDWVAVDRIDGVAVRYDSVAQRLEVDMPAQWLPAQHLGSGAGQDPAPIAPGRGVVLNYDLYASHVEGGSASLSLWNEQRWFGAWGVLSNTGIVRRGGRLSWAGTGQGYLRYDTSWRWADRARVRTLIVGDLITGALPWGRAVRIGGVQIARSFEIRPDLVPFPVPSFAGEAAVPSSVDLFLNGQRTASEQVQPGPFVFNTLPYVNGAGEAALVTTDALGRQVQTTLPFYVSSTLLKPGTSDYSLAAGALRRGYGIESFGYGRPGNTE